MYNKDIKVSVCCTVYNHEKYLRKCLDGFVMQKTNFAFEVLVNDDKSTDSSAEIIREYYEKYPNIIVPVFQSENQYSKGVQILDDILYPIARGKYIALCEGDDYWCDENKLQLQFDYMESNEDCVMCLHNTVFHYLNRNYGNYKDRLFNNWKTIHTLNAEDVFLDWSVHTSSYFIRKEYAKKPDFGRNCWAGDMVIRTWLYTIGKLVALPQIMSVYNAGVENSATELNANSLEIHQKNSNDIIKYYESLNSFTSKKFNNIINKRIRMQRFNSLLFEKTYIIKNSENKKEIIEAARAIISHEYYSEFIESKHGLTRLLMRFKYEGYVIYPIWILAYRLYYGRKQNKRKS